MAAATNAPATNASVPFDSVLGQLMQEARRNAPSGTTLTPFDEMVLQAGRAVAERIARGPKGIPTAAGRRLANVLADFYAEQGINPSFQYSWYQLPQGAVPTQDLVQEARKVFLDAAQRGDLTNAFSALGSLIMPREGGAFGQRLADSAFRGVLNEIFTGSVYDPNTNTYQLPANVLQNIVTRYLGVQGSLPTLSGLPNAPSTTTFMPSGQSTTTTPPATTTVAPPAQVPFATSQVATPTTAPAIPTSDNNMTLMSWPERVQSDINRYLRTAIFGNSPEIEREVLDSLKQTLQRSGASADWTLRALSDNNTVSRLIQLIGPAGLNELKVWAQLNLPRNPSWQPGATSNPIEQFVNLVTAQRR